MRYTRAAGSIAAAASGLVLLTAACGSSGDHPGSPGSTAGSTGSGATGGGPDLGNLDGSNGGSSSVHDPIDDCAGDLVEAKRIPLDMYVMLDVSSSMLSPTIGDQTVSKWQAVSSALVEFVNDPESAGLGMGLQLFPLPHPDVPAECTTNAECGEFGPCFLSVCWPPAPNAGLRSCNADAPQPDVCNLNQTCIPFGVCENDANYVCPTVGAPCGVADDLVTQLGDCVVAPPSECMVTADCRTATYATPAAPIAALPGASAGLVAVIRGAEPDGFTPSRPALSGALRAASTWAEAHVDHKVVAVLATDGLPTLRAGAATAKGCVSITTTEEANAEIGAITQLASSAVAATPGISTFVIGVLGPDDGSAPLILDAIAQAGGTEQAFIVDTTGNVSTQFRDALNAIRSGGLSCELQVPEPAAGKALDFHAVNVVVDDGSGAEELVYVGQASECGVTGGWYYDVDPDQAGGGRPERIVTCPATCQAFSRIETGSVAIKLGCVTKTQIR